MKLISYNKYEDDKSSIVAAKAKYEFKHNTSGREGTCFTFDITFDINLTEYVKNGHEPKIFSVSKIDFGEINHDSAEESFDKLAELFERAAIALKTRYPKTSLPI